MIEALTGTITLYRATFKQTFWSMFPWIIGVLLLVVSSYQAYEVVFPDLQDRQRLAGSIGANPAFALLFGKAVDLLSAEGFTVWRSVMLGSFITALMSILTVVKLTRSQEDSGQSELLQSYPVGRYSLPVVGLLVAWSGCLLLAIGNVAILGILGANFTVIFLIALAFLTSGMLFGVVATISSQLSSSGRSATSLAIGFLGISYLLRGFADTVEGAEFLAWLSPLGWVQKFDIGGQNELWPLGVFMLFSILGLGLALFLKSKRDFGQGIIADRPGNDRAKLTRSIYGLAVALNLTSMIIWTVGFIFFGTMFGIILSSAGDSLADNENFSKFLGSIEGLSNYDFIFEFARTLFSILGILTAIYGIQIVFRLASEERQYRIEPLLAGSVTRFKLFFSHVSLSFGASILAALASGLALTLSAWVNDSQIESLDLIEQSLVSIPPILVHIGLAIFLMGFIPRWNFIAWLAVVASFGLIILGPILEVDEGILSLTPFWHIVSTSQPNYSMEPSLIMLLITMSLTMLGFWGFRRRDIGV